MVYRLEQQRRALFFEKLEEKHTKSSIMDYENTTKMTSCTIKMQLKQKYRNNFQFESFAQSGANGRSFLSSKFLSISLNHPMKEHFNTLDKLFGF